ncbi:fatty acid desaturase family protein [Pseudohalioglobus sediminis]|uniref:Fatty acid desaturase family protein n=1 Tax=Pseudohalioglobus sediminis TaxID=2606449 RepID=A0A5B0WW02_9GAMM|nr:fatty acid desaturase family protein [Pseudohalioglobus sediminis]KAA1190059.1 fatty acid desaturase family protein [Pseudohalioglobus sediminis]
MTTASATTTRPLSAYLSNDEIRSLQAFSPARVWIDTLFTWALVLACLAACATWNNPVLWVLSFVVIASRQLALTHLVHDASHYRLFASRQFNDLFSDILLAGPVGISTASYRAQHLPHHRYLGDRTRDSDQRSWYAIKGGLFWKRTLLTLAGWEALVTFGSYARADGGGENSGLLWRLCCAALGNGLLLLYCWWLGQPALYLVMWFLPLLTLTMLLQNYRVIAEHQPESYAARGIDRAPESFTPALTRTLQPGPMGRFLLGPMNFYYHHEHHLMPSVPYHQLPRMHRLLQDRGYFRDHSEVLGSGYAQTLYKLVRPQRSTTNG